MLVVAEKLELVRRLRVEDVDYVHHKVQICKTLPTGVESQHFRRV